VNFTVAQDSPNQHLKILSRQLLQEKKLTKRLGKILLYL
jgi:hypothetical protein